MSKKRKPQIDLSQKEITYEMDNIKYKVVRFNPNYMTIDANLHYSNGKKESITIPFAQLPKKIKKIIRPM